MRRNLCNLRHSGIHLSVVIASGLPTVFHIFAHTVPAEERSKAFGYLIAAGSVGQTLSSIVSMNENSATSYH